MSHKRKTCQSEDDHNQSRMSDESILHTLLEPPKKKTRYSVTNRQMVQDMDKHIIQLIQQANELERQVYRNRQYLKYVCNLQMQNKSLHKRMSELQRQNNIILHLLASFQEQKSTTNQSTVSSALKNTQNDPVVPYFLNELNE